MNGFLLHQAMGTLPLGQIEPLGLFIGAVGGIIVGLIVTLVIMKNMASSGLKRSKTEADEIVAKAKTNAAEMIKKAEVDGKAEYLKIKENADKEVDSTRKEMREQEQRLQKREDVLDRK